MNTDNWRQARYRAEVWEGKETTVVINKVTPTGSKPQAGETVLLYYAQRINLGDHGADLGFDEGNHEPDIKLEPEQYFVKFFGTSRERLNHNASVIDQIKGLGCNRVLSYTDPKHAYMQRADVRLTPYVANILNDKFDSLLSKLGRISEDELERIN